MWIFDDKWPSNFKVIFSYYNHAEQWRKKPCYNFLEAYKTDCCSALLYAYSIVDWSSVSCDEFCCYVLASEKTYPPFLFQLRQLNNEQTKEWTKLLERFMEEEFHVRTSQHEKRHKAVVEVSYIWARIFFAFFIRICLLDFPATISISESLLIKFSALFVLQALHDMQNGQIKEMQAANARESKQLQLQQSQKSIDSKGNIKNDKALKPAERERRIKEIEQNNAKLFAQQRASQRQAHQRRLDKLVEKHKQEEEEVVRALEEVRRIRGCGSLMWCWQG